MKQKYDIHPSSQPFVAKGNDNMLNIKGIINKDTKTACVKNSMNRLNTSIFNEYDWGFSLT